MNESLPQRLRQRRKACTKCGAVFELEYDPKTGQAVQRYPARCGPETQCFRENMPPSDFRPHPPRPT